MDLETQLQLAIKEKDMTIIQCSQNKLLIEKLEEELKLLREISPAGNKNIINMLQKEYSDMIIELQEKIKAIQEKYKEEICNSTRKEDEARVLHKRIDELNTRLLEAEQDRSSAHVFLKQEREKYLVLEKDFIHVQSQLFSFEKRNSCLQMLENERDGLMTENRKLSDDCNELETALEICHQKMHRYEEEILQYCKCLDMLKSENETIVLNENANKEIVNNLQQVVGELNVDNENLKKELISTKNKFNEYLDNIAVQFSVENIFRELEDNFDKIKATSEEDAEKRRNCDTISPEFNNLKTYTLFHNYKKKLLELMSEKIMLQDKLEIILSNVEKYKVYVLEANNAIVCLEQELSRQDKKLKISGKREDLQTYLINIENTNSELQKQIKSQEELHRKWRKEVAELINRFKNRITHLNNNYKHSQKENEKLKNTIRKMTTVDKTKNESSY